MITTQEDISLYLNSSATQNFFLFAGPCVIEGEEAAMGIAECLLEITNALDIPFIFKGSYRKANRSRVDSFTGIGDSKALQILHKVKEEFNIPVITDIHSCEEAQIAAEYVDILQIPAFLCRQTDLLAAAAATGKMINIKKGQFLSPSAMKFAVEKVRNYGNSSVCVTDRGTSFGYSDLVIDFRGIPIMQQECKCPVIMDITHSLQQPNAPEGITGGLPLLIETIGRCSIAAGVDGIFMETHPDPQKAKSDGANMLPLSQAKSLLKKLTAIRQVINNL